MDWSTLLENVLDASHVPFTHHKSISNRNVIGDYNTKLTSPMTEAGFQGLWATGPRWVTGWPGDRRCAWMCGSPPWEALVGEPGRGWGEGAWLGTVNPEGAHPPFLCPRGLPGAPDNAAWPLPQMHAGRASWAPSRGSSLPRAS